MKKQEFKSTCSYCGVGCGVVVKKDGRGRLSVEGNKDYPVNKGMLCSKGINLHHVVQDKTDRILYPQMRWNRSSEMKRVSWDQAYQRAVGVFQSIIKRHGPDSVAFYVSGQCTTEEYYLVNKLTKGFLGTNNVDTNSRLCMSSAVVGYKRTLGEDSVPISYEDIELADTFLIAGANPAWCHPILFRRIEKHKEKNPDTKIIVVDPRRTDSCSIADLHIQINPGSDIYLYQAIAKQIIDNGDVDKFFIDSYTQGFGDLKAALAKFSIKSAAEQCGIPISDIELAAKYIGKSKAYISMWAMGLNQSAVGVDKNLALLNLNTITGNIGRPGAGPFSLTGQPNAMGGREVGGMANLLAVHKDLGNPVHRQEVADFWGVEQINPKPGLTATRMFEELETGKLKAIWVICTNPSVSLPDAKKVDAAFKNAKFVVVQDISHKSDTTKYADLLLPAAGWAEKEGTMTNSERRISYLPKIVDAPGEAKPDAEILWTFAQKMGFHGFEFSHVSEVYEEYCRMTKGTNIDIYGLSYERLKTKGSVQWPVPFEDHQGTPRLFEDKQFYTPTKKAFINVPEHLENQSESTDDTFPLILTTGRLRDQWHTMTKTGKVNRLKRHIKNSFVQIAPSLAKEKGLDEGDIVEVTSRRGSYRGEVKLSKDIKHNVIFIPMHYGKAQNDDFARANNLTNTLLDPHSKQPDFKFSAVRLEKYVKPKEKICVVGAGAAAFQFIKQYREYNKRDEVHVFSLEQHPFYNRILLPEYISEHLTWAQLQKIKKEELDAYDVQIHESVEVISVDKNRKTILTKDKQEHTYDQLILATGSRSFVPSEVPIHLPGVFTIRSKVDADTLKAYLDETTLPKQEQKVIIIGGGLLGLEVAAALKKMNIQVVIVERGARLMERQLDVLSSQLLAEDVLERNIDVYFDNEVNTITQVEGKNEVTVNLKSGVDLHANAIVYAIGTIPNTQLAIDAGLTVKRGVVIDDYLRTSDEHIYAIGEIAEHNGIRYGITAAAEKQANILARYFDGDKNSYFDGATFMNVLKFENLDLCSIGEVNIPADSRDYEEIIFKDTSQRYYKKCIIYKDKMVGAILMGDKSEFLEFKKLIDEKIELSEKRLELLRSSKKKEVTIGRVVCSCNFVGKGNIENAISRGCNSVDEIGEETMAGTACGSCKVELKEILLAYQKEHVNSKQNGSKASLSEEERKRKKSIFDLIKI